MKTLTFVARPHHRLTYHDTEGDVHVVHGGEVFIVSDELAEELLTQPHLTIVESTEDRSKLRREQLDELATQAGLDPAAFANKAELIEALDNLDETPAEEAPAS